MPTFNTFTPLLTTSNPNGRSQPPVVSVDTSGTSAGNFATLLRNRAYARMDASTIALSNPEFDTGAAGRLIGSLTEGNAGNSPQISRGYIRRTVLDNGDPTSQYRLYFMFNPETIQRNYVSYLDQEALDPFNTIFGSNNLVAPPGVLDFDFDLFFDRQAENANGSMPRGVLEDFDFFDLVVRGVVPDTQSTALPDNGIMMINPRNVTVIFSPQLSVQGRPNTASVVYEKFDHRMRPVRMRIHIGLKAFYIGPVRSDFTFAQSKEQGTASATIPYDESVKFALTTESLKAGTPTAVTPFNNNVAQGYLQGIQNVLGGPNSATRESALATAESLGENKYPYVQNEPIALDPAQGLDCAGLIFWAYRKIGALAFLGFTDPTMNGWTIINNARRIGTLIADGNLSSSFLANSIQRGDILAGPQHVSFVSNPHPQEGAGFIQVYESDHPGMGPAHHTWDYGTIFSSFNHTCAVRPAVGPG